MPLRDMYSASYAALPHLVRAGADHDPLACAQHLHLAGSIASARHAHAAPVMPSDLCEAYERGLIELQLVSAETLVKADDEESLLVAAGAMAATKVSVFWDGCFRTSVPSSPAQLAALWSSTSARSYSTITESS